MKHIKYYSIKYNIHNKNTMITVNIMGGLGNQLFEIFACIATALENNHNFVFPYSTMVDNALKRPAYWDTFLIHLRSYTDENKNFNHFTHLSNYQHHYIKIQPLCDNENYILCGYYQTAHYFEKYKKEIFNMIHLDEMKTAVKNECNLKHDKDMYVIGMHFRVGDYKHKQEFHNLLKLDYYKKALKHVLHKTADKIANKKVIIQCYYEKEDTVHVVDIVTELKLMLIQLTETIQYKFQFTNTDYDDWKQLLLMSFSNSMIIANSSFSWWGAYFNEKPDVICFPSVWFGPLNEHLLLHDMCPSTWHKIECNK